MFLSLTHRSPMLSVYRIEENIYLIDTNALGQKNTVAVYLIKDKKNALIDCGYASSYMNVVSSIKEIGIDVNDLDYLIPTHVHLDHGGAAGHLAQVFKKAKVLAHERAVPHLANPDKLIKSATEVFGKEIIETYGLPIPVQDQRMEAVGKEMELSLGDTNLSIIYSPGHAPHQVSITVDKRKTILTADTVGIVYPDVKAMIPTTPPPSFDPDLLISTLDTLEQTDPKRLLVPHFGIREDPKEVFGMTKQKVREWVSKVRKMKKENMDLSEIQKKLEAEVASESSLDELPIYAKISIRTSILGILHYIEKVG